MNYGIYSTFVLKRNKSPIDWLGSTTAHGTPGGIGHGGMGGRTGCTGVWSNWFNA